MLKTISNAFGVCRAALGKIKKITKPVTKFMLHVVPLWLGMNCTYTFMNLQRWGGRNEKSYRNMFSRKMDWYSFNEQIVKECFEGKEVVALYDPSYIKKSGKKTYGLASFWSGTAGKAKKGLELGCLAFVSVEDHTALHGVAVQSPTPASLHRKGLTSIDHHAGVILQHASSIQALTRYIALDGYFGKRNFIDTLVEAGFYVITKVRSDAHLKYVYEGVQKARGRHRIYDGKIDTRKLNKKKIPLIYSDQEKDVYAAVVYAAGLKRFALAAFIYYKDDKTGKIKKDKKGRIRKPEIVIATDTEMKVEKMCLYYDLRFQVEFLIRDSKSFAGLEDCQARSKEKLNNHFNIAMTSVSVAKAAYYITLPKKDRGSFSMADIKMMHMNELITKRIFSNLDIDPSCKKYQQAYEDCLNFGRYRA
jgi:hypothetical protein